MQKHIRPLWWLFVLPTLTAFSIAFLIPFILGIGLSFTRFTTVTSISWAGIQNYIDAFSSDRDFLNALRLTLRFTAVTLVTVNVPAFLLALALTRGLKGTNLFRTVFFLPNLIGGIVLGWLWQVIFNGALAPLGKTLTSDASYGFWGLVILSSWQMIGYMMLIYIAGLTAIPEELYDAASVDGASAAQTLFRLTLPMLASSITICVFLTLSNSLKLFDQNLALTAGAPGKRTSMLALDIYNTFYGRAGWQGVGQAKAVVFFVLAAGVSALQLAATGRGEAKAS